MRIDDDTLGRVEPFAQNDTGRLAADTRQRHEVIHIIRHLAAEFMEYLHGRLLDRFGLVVIQPDGFDIAFELRYVRPGEGLDGFVLFE